MEYQRIYTELRTAKLSFADFMDFVSHIYNLGVEKGSLSVASESSAARIAAAPPSEQYEYRPHQL